MNTVAVIQARMGSTRLPGKVLAPLGNASVLDWVVRAAKAAVGIDQVVVATSTQPDDQIIFERCRFYDNVACIRGSENDVLSRFWLVAEATRAEVFLRITADEPFIDPRVISEVVALQRRTGADYVSNIHPRTYPDGLDVECFSRDALRCANMETTRPIDRDTVTYWIVRNAHRFPAACVINGLPGLQHERWVLDTADDMRFCQEVAKRWPWDKGPPSQMDILDILDKEPWIRKINGGGVPHTMMNERFYQALADEPLYRRSYSTSRKMLRRAEKTIPLGAQTFSKSKLQYPKEAPLFLTHGQGGLVWDVDGNEYVDLVGGLLPNILGYRDPDVDSAIRAQLNKGISFSLATDLEYRLAEKLKELIPCADMARFGKNGTDVTTAGIRLSRAYTGRERVLSSGYHGWADVFITHDHIRNDGVPESMKELTTIFQYGNTVEARKHLDTRSYACCIVEPETDPSFLSQLRTACNATGTILIFDEIITGFRFDLGGAQKLYGVTPDLATFGKAMANGMPISALVGKKRIMQNMEHVCFSGTFFGEALSLAAALATIEKMEREPVLQTIHGNNLELLKYFEKHQYNYTFMEVAGQQLPRLKFYDISASFGQFSKEDIKTLWMQEMIANGVLVIASANLCYAHGPSELRRIYKAADAAFDTLGRAFEKNDIKSRIKGHSISPTANIRALA